MLGASPQQRLGLLSSASLETPGAAAAEEKAGEQPTTPRGATIGSSSSSAQAAAASAAAPAAAAQPPQRPAPKRSPLLGSPPGRGAKAKLESFDKMLSRQPVAHVRLSAAPAAAKPSGARGWLSPGKATPAAAATAGKKSAAAAAAAATVAAAAGGGMPMPGRLRRSNSDPSLASSLGSAPLASVAAAGGQPPVQRRVTFHGNATVFDGSHTAASLASHSGGAGGAGGLQRHSTAPSASLVQYAQEAAAANASMVGNLYLLDTANEPSYHNSGNGSSSFGGGDGGSSSLRQGGSMRRRSASYHTLPGLSLEGIAADPAEASSFNQGGRQAYPSLLAPACLPS
jgi:hypothetical protein